MLVKSSSATIAMIRFAIEGKSGYGDILNNMNSSVRYTAEPTFEAGYSFVELNLTEFANYSGDKTAKIGGFHIHFYDSSRIPESFAVYGIYTDPVDEAPADKLAEMSGKTLLKYSLAAESYETNKNASEFDGTLMTSGQNMEIKASITSGTVYLLVHASKASTGYFRFAIEGKTGYVDIMEHSGDSVKYFNAVAVPEGYSILTINLAKYADYNGDANAKVGGFHINFWGDNLDYFNIFGVWQEPIEEIPADALAEVEGKTALSYSLTANGGWMTNSDGKVVRDDFSGYITSVGCHLSLNIGGVTNKVYIIIKSSADAIAYLRFGATANATYETYVNDPNNYSEYTNNLSIEAGIHVLAVTLSKNPEYVGTTGGSIAAMYLQLGTAINYTIYGIYAEPVDSVPSEILAKIEGKTALSYELAAVSWETNANALKDENEVIHASKTNVELKVAINTTKIYMIVKSSSDKIAKIRFAIDGKTGWVDVVEKPSTSAKYTAEPLMYAGYSLVEINLTANADYTGDADAAIGGFHMHFYNGAPDSFEIFGIYVD